MPGLLFFGKLIYLIPASIGMLVLRVWRWCARSLLLSRAESWQVTDAVVESSFELDESAKRVRNLLKNLFVSSMDEGESARKWRYVHPVGDTMVDVYDDDHGNDPSKPWIVGLRYSYRVEGNIYAGTYFLPVAYANSGSACKASRLWNGKQIIIRYNPEHQEQSVFLQEDGAPGKPRIPAGWDSEPYLTSLSLK